jgi:hypothetical protein
MYRSIYAYPWDLADEGVPEVVARVTALGLDTITLAGAYHAGKFLRPHGRNGRVYFPDDGTVYFTAEPLQYGHLTPVLSRLVAERDVLGELAQQTAVKTNVWLVLLHNSRLGQRYPHATVANAFGDRYIYSLCPSAPEVREYAVALCKDVTDHYPVAGITIETPGFLPYAHGYHHEFALVKPNAWLDGMLGLCFCDHCVNGARAAGLDAVALRRYVAEQIDGYLGGPLDLPNEMARALWQSDATSGGTLAGFIEWRCTVVTSLVREIRSAVRSDATVAAIPTVARPTSGAWYEGSDISALADAAGLVEACLYEPTVDRVREDLRETRERVHGSALRAVLRPSFPDLQSRSDVVDAARACRDAGLAGIAFYNYGHLRRSNLAWIADAVSAFGA